MKVYKKIVDGICFVLEILAAAMLVVMVLIIGYHVFMRYVMNAAPRWSEEISLQLMIYFCFIAMLLGVKEQVHIAIELFMKKLPKKALFVVEIFDKVMILIFGFCMGYFILSYLTNPVLKGNKLPATGIPVFYQYLMPCIVGFMIMFITVEQIILQIKEGPSSVETAKEAAAKNAAKVEAEKAAALNESEEVTSV